MYGIRIARACICLMGECESCKVKIMGRCGAGYEEGFMRFTRDRANLNVH